MAVHERVWEQSNPHYGEPQAPPGGRPSAAPAGPWKPVATYSLLGIMVSVLFLQFLVLGTYGEGTYLYLFTITPLWYLHPWSLITSTFSHGGVQHLFFNGLMLYFFGPSAERILGRQKFVALFIVAGAISGLMQVILQPSPALGASGALMMVFGLLAYLMPKQQILIFGIVPTPFWLAAAGYALLDIFGAFHPNNGIGNFAHLSGMTLGLYLGYLTKKDLERRGLVLVH